MSTHAAEAKRPNAIAAPDVLDALGNPVRRKILDALRGGPRAVGAIASTLPVSRPAVSRHLRQLEAAGLVRHSREGTRNLFELDDEGFAEARRWLDGFWDEALRRFAMVAENLPEPSQHEPSQHEPSQHEPSHDK